MSHDEIGGPVTRKERRKARGGERQAAPRCVFKVSDHVRQDWSVEDVIAQLYCRARGYNGILRQLLCTTAEVLRRNEVALTGYRDQAISEAVDAEVAAPIVPVNISKRNQQPGRLSGSEREALKKFVSLVTVGDVPREEIMSEGRAMLAKVRKRALGVNAEPENLKDFVARTHDEMRVRETHDEDIVANIMDPEILVDEEANYTAFGPDGDPA